MEKPKRARRRKPETAKADLSHRSMSFGGQGARREAGSEGYAEKYRAVVDEGYIKDDRSAERWGKVE